MSTPAPYYEKMLVADMAALKELSELSEPVIADGIFIGVIDRGDGTPDWYYYDIDATDTENLPDIAQPTTSPGRWFRFNAGPPLGMVVTRSDSYPIGPPPYDGTDGRISYHYRITGSDSSLTVAVHIGIDSTGMNGDNGWAYSDNWYA